MTLDDSVVAPAPGPATVSIDTARTTTDGALAATILSDQIGEIRRLVDERGGDARLERQLTTRLLQRASYLGSYDDFDELDALTEADVARAPDDATAWQLRSSFLSATHRFEEARAAIDEAERAGAYPRSVERTRWLLDMSLGADPEALVESAERRLAEHETFQHVADRGLALAEAGRFEEADEAFRDALALHEDPSPFPVAWIAFQRGVMWAERADRADLAVPLYGEAVRRLPGYVVANVHLAELEAEGGNADVARSRLRVLANTVGDPEPAGLLAEIITDETEATRLVGLARDRYDVLLNRHRLAFLDHGSEFFSGPAGDTARGLELARENLEARGNARAYKVAIEAALANGDLALACDLAIESEPLQGRHPVLAATAEGVCE